MLTELTWKCVFVSTQECTMMGNVWEATLQLPDKREEAYHNTRQTRTNTHTHSHTLLISSSVSSSSHQPSPRWLSPPPPPPPPEPSQQSCQADSSKLRGKWVSLALQSRRTDSISTIWNWARGAESGRQRRVPLSEGEGEFRRRH